MRGNEIRHILLKQFHLITLDINTIEHLCISPCTLRNRDTFERWSVDFKTISVPFTRARSNVLCVAIVTSQGWMGLWRHCWRRQWLERVHCIDWEWDLWLECPLRFTSYFVSFYYYFIFHVKKWLRMVARALWRSEALRTVPWLRPLNAPGICFPRRII